MSSASMTAEEIVAHFGLKPLDEEGGYFRRLVRPEPGVCDTSAIIYLITPDTWSGLHRLKAPELFHFYLGDPCQMVIAPEGQPIEKRILGQDIRNGQLVQTLVPANSWQGTRLVGGGPTGWALLGTTMTPGFRPDLFEMATAAHLTRWSIAEQLTLQTFLGGREP